LLKYIFTTVLLFIQDTSLIVYCYSFVSLSVFRLLSRPKSKPIELLLFNRTTDGSLSETGSILNSWGINNTFGPFFLRYFTNKHFIVLALQLSVLCSFLFPWRYYFLTKRIIFSAWSYVPYTNCLSYLFRGSYLIIIMTMRMFLFIGKWIF
jgi:hypothetical protein